MEKLNSSHSKGLRDKETTGFFFSSCKFLHHTLPHFGSAAAIPPFIILLTVCMVLFARHLEQVPKSLPSHLS